MRSVYDVMDQKCPNLDTLVMGQSFIFVPELVRDLNTKLSRLNKLVVLKLMYIATDMGRSLSPDHPPVSYTHLTLPTKA